MRVLRAFAVIVALGVLVVGTVRAQTMTPVVVGILANDDIMPLIYASRTGMFAKAGLDVTFDRSAANGAAIGAAVLGGSYTVGKSSPPAIIDAHLRGVPFTIVATGGIYESRAPFACMIVLKSSPIRSGRDLANSMIGLSALRGLGQMALVKIFDEAGLSTSNMKFVEVPMTTAIAAVATGRVAAAELTYPPLQAAVETGQFRLLPVYTALASRFAISVWFTTKDYAAKHPEVVKTFARVVADAARFTNSHHDVTAPLLAEFTGIPLETIKKMPRVTAGTGVSAALIQPLIDVEAKYGFIAHAFSAEEMIDPDVERR